MATSGSKSVTVTSWDTLKFSWWEDSQSVANNTTTVGWKMELIAGSSGRISSTASKDWSVTVNGKTYSGTNTIGISNNATKTLASGTTTITHTSNGTKTFDYSFSQEFAITFSGSSIGTKSGSGSGTLDTIPRASSFTASNGTLGTALNLSVTKQDSSFTHTITYVCGSASGTVCTKSSSTTVVWNTSNGNTLNLAKQNTTGTTVSVTFTLTTYSGSTSVGTASKTVTMTIPASVKPSCMVTVTDPTGYSDTYGSPVKGLSKFKVVVNPTTAQGSAINSYKTTISGTTYTASSFTTGVLASSGSVTVSSTVTDKRNRTSDKANKTISVLDYSAPIITRLTVGRCDSEEEGGTNNDQGEWVKVTFNATISPLNNLNSSKYTIRYKRTAESNYTYVTLHESDAETNPVYDYTADYYFEADTGSSYNVELVVTDSHNTTTRVTTASTGFTLMHFGIDGTGIGIGKMSEENDLLDIGLPTRFNNPVYGKALGMDKLPAIPANSDLNDYMEPGCYAIQSNAIAATCSCGGEQLGTEASLPIARAGRLEVWSSTGEGIRTTQWSYIRQRFIPYNSDNAVWERDITRSADNVWRYYDWWKSSLTPSASEKVYHEQKFLWGDDMTSGMFMTAGHTAKLKEAVSAQPNGIILVFCAFNGTSDTNYSWQSFFVPKTLVAASTSGHTFTLGRGKFTYTGTKYLYIYDTYITGHADNNVAGSNNGISYDNSKFVLRYVIGV